MTLVEVLSQLGHILEPGRKVQLVCTSLFCTKCNNYFSTFPTDLKSANNDKIITNAQVCYASNDGHFGVTYVKDGIWTWYPKLTCDEWIIQEIIK